MKLAELIRAIHDNGEDIDPPREERVLQYKNVFGDDLTNEVTGKFNSKNWREIGNKYFSGLRDRITLANPQYASAWNQAEIVTINTQEEKTSVHSRGDSDVIVVDSLMMTFLWTMNKAHVYGKRLAGGEQLKLIVELLLHFGTLRHFGIKGPVWPRPKTPLHESQAEFSSLFCLTNTQELFMVAHEMAHLVCDNKSNLQADLICQGQYPATYMMMFEQDPRIADELMADELAVDLVLNAFPRTRAVEEIVLSAIFLLIRYRLWLAIACKKTETNYEFILWFARNSLFRAKANRSYKGGAAVFLIDLLEELEQTLEPGALKAAEAFELILEQTKGC